MARSFVKGTSLAASASVAHGIGTGDFTFVAWVRYTSGGGGGGNQATIWANGSFAPAFYAAVGSGQLEVADTTNGSQTFAGSLTANVWTHVALRRLGGTYALWVDGVQDATTHSSSVSLPDGVQRLAESGAGSQGYTGRLAECALFTRAINANEIMALARGTAPDRLLSRPLCYWPLWGVHDPEIDLGSTRSSQALTGTPVRSDHAPVVPFSRRLWNQRVEPPAATTHECAGQGDGVGATTGALAVTYLIAGQSNGVGAVTGAMLITGALAGTAAGTSTAVGNLVFTATMAGVAAGVATARGTLTAVGDAITDLGSDDLGLIVEGYRPACNLAVNTGTNIAVPTITFATDGANGTYIRKLRLGSQVFNFADTQLFRAGLWDGNGTYFLMDGEQWNPTIETDAFTGVVTLTQEMGEIDVTMTGISFVCRLTPIAEGYQVSTIAMNNANATYAVEWFEFPRLGCKSQTSDPSNLMLAHGFIGGMVLKDPHNVTLDDVLRNTLSNPPNMQYLSYWDITTKEHLYISTDDDNGSQKNMILTGNGSFSTLAFMHWFPNPRTVGNAGVVPYTMPYNVNIELFKGRTADGRCGYYDAAIRYRTWGTNMSRSWMIEAEGPWMDADDVSTHVKNSDFYYVSGHSNSSAPANFWSDIVEDMDRVKTIIGADETLGLLYGWAENIAFLTDLQPPAFTPLIQGTDQNTALGVADGLGIHLSYYTLLPFWESSLSGHVPFDYDNFIGTIDYNNITQYTIRDEDNTPVPPEGPGLEPGVPVFPEGVP